MSNYYLTEAERSARARGAALRRRDEERRERQRRLGIVGGVISREAREREKRVRKRERDTLYRERKKTRTLLADIEAQVIRVIADTAAITTTEEKLAHQRLLDDALGRSSEPSQRPLLPLETVLIYGDEYLVPTILIDEINQLRRNERNELGPVIRTVRFERLDDL